MLVASRGKISVSARITDDAGALIGEIVDNEWKVDPSRAFDRTFDANGSEVRCLDHSPTGPRWEEQRS